jgi:L-lactate utilization protein LutB
LPCDSHYPKTQDSGYSQNQTYYYRNDDGKKLVLLHVIKEANDVVKDVIKETDDVVKGKENVTKEFAKAQR